MCGKGQKQLIRFSIAKDLALQNPLFNPHTSKRYGQSWHVIPFYGRHS